MDNGSGVESWEDDGGGGRNTGLSKYAQVKPEGEGEATIMEPLGDQSNIWAQELQGMSQRQGVTWTSKNDDGTLKAPFGEEAGDHNSTLFGQALNGSINSESEAKDGLDEQNSINPDGVDLGVGKGKHYDHKMGFNAGRNTVEIAKTGGVSSNYKANGVPDDSNPFRPNTSGAEIGETDDENHSISHMSDISSGELMQRFPPSSNINNTFVKELYKGLFTEVEKKEIFLPVLPEIEEVIEETNRRLLAKQERLQRGQDDRGWETGQDQGQGLSNEVLADPLYELFSTLERRMENNEQKAENRLEEMFRHLTAIRQKTDNIKERRLLRPADFE